jgi:hypothetical protein
MASAALVQHLSAVVVAMPNMAVDQEVLVQMPEVVRVVGVRSMVVPAVAAVAVATPAVLR